MHVFPQHQLIVGAINTERLHISQRVFFFEGVLLVCG